MNAENTVYYCYAVTRAVPVEHLDGLRGIHGIPVEPIPCGGLAAVASPVPADEFNESALQSNLENLSWLEDVARTHNTVVDHVAHGAVTLPFRLATIYLNADRVRDVLRAGNQQLSTALDHIDGRMEWGVKIYTIEAPGPAPSNAGKAESGRAYLKQRLQHRDTRDDSLRQAEESAVHIDGTLSSMSDNRRRHHPQNPELSSARGQNVFNAAYLVRSAAEQSFADRVNQLREQLPRCRIELTGPWVPYSFALDEVPEDDSGE